jgi:hypothetical protein
MKLPPLNADASFYKTSMSYSSARKPRSALAGITPSSFFPTPHFLPAGSYLRSCSACRADNNFLQCQCLDFGGTLHFTAIGNPYSCSGAINNCNGALRCGSCP